jgi:O-antigen/teichoic acid export membrane protein
MLSLSNPRSATLFEQAMLSGTGFLSMLFFARHLSTLDWATFSFASSLLLLCQGMQLSIVILPMISFSKGDSFLQDEQQHWTWMNRMVLMSMLIFSVVSGGLMSWGTSSWMGDSFLYAAVLMPPAFTYEYLRRRLILAKRFSVLARTGLAYAVGVAIGVGGNYVFEWPLVFAALPYWVGMICALYVSGVRDPIRWSAPGAKWLAPLTTFAPSAIGSAFAFAGYNFAVQAILGAISGPLAVASFNATRMLIQPINTLIGAFNNLDMPNAAKAFARGGHALVKFQARSILRLSAIGGLYLAVLSLLAGPLLTLLFEGRYNDKNMVWAWVLVGLLMLVVTPTENVFYVVRRPQLLFASRIGASAVGCLCAYYSIPVLGAFGGVLSIAAGWSIALLGGLVALWNVRHQHGTTGDAGP